MKKTILILTGLILAGIVSASYSKQERDSLIIISSADSLAIGVSGDSSVFYTDVAKFKFNEDIHSDSVIRARSFKVDTTLNEDLEKGQIGWSASDDTPLIGLGGGVNGNVFEEQLLTVRNNSGATIGDFKVVYQTGQTGLKPTIDTASVSTYAKAFMIGVATQDIINNANGRVNTKGIVRDVNTSALTEGLRGFLDVEGNLTEDSTRNGLIVSVGKTLVSNPSNGAFMVDIKEPLCNDSNLTTPFTTIAPSCNAVRKFKDSNIAYGGLHVHDNSTPQSVATGAVYTKMTAFADQELTYNATSEADSVTVDVQGAYLVNGSFSLTSGTNNVITFGTVFVNGVEQDNVHFQRKIATGTDVGSCSISGIVYMNAGDYIDFRMRHDNGAAVDITLSYANLTVTLLRKY